VEFRYRTPLTADFGLGALHAQGYEAIFLAVGAGRARGLRIPGVELDGVILAIDFLLNVNRGYRVGIGRRVVVVGGGLVALDAARTAIRTAAGRVGEDEVGGTALRVALDAAREAMRRGALEVTVASLESLTEMPAMKSVQGREEVATCEAEGVRFLPAWGPRAIHGRAGRAAAIELIRCVRVFDEAGRFSPAFDEATTQTVPADTVLLAIGQNPDISFLRPEDGVETGPGGMIRVDPETLATTARGVFAGGDGAFPPAIIVTVAAHGKRAARSIDAYLHGEAPPTRLRARVEALPIDTYRMPGYERQPRFVPTLPIKRRTGIAEVELCYSEADARAQAGRCLACHVHPIYDGDRCVLCGRCADVCPEDCIRFLPLDRVELPPLQRDALAPRLGGTGDGFTALLYDGARCIRCGLCALRCPTGAITMERFRFEEG